MSALESSITLDDVFVVVGAKRVPLAAELAGYLALEIAEGAGASGEIDPKSVYIGEEGTVALVRKREGRDGAEGPDAEGSIRAILARLLDASGSQTAALGNLARRKNGGGVGALIEELEAALIPVNRAAGRRALARLAREVKRVALGVGRNAAVPPDAPPPKRAPLPSVAPARDNGPPPPRTADEPRPPSRPNLVDEVAAPAKPEPSAEPPAVRRPMDPAELPTIEFRRDQATKALPPVSPPPPAPVAASATPAPPAAASPPPAPPPPQAPTPTPLPPGSDVDQLLASFGVSGGGEKLASRDLKALVGLEPTPPPPGSFGRDLLRPTRKGDEDDVEALLSMGDSSEQPPRARAALASPPTSISPALANEPFGRHGSGRFGTASPVETPPTLASTGAPPARAPTPTPVKDVDEPRVARAAPTGPSMRRLSESEFRPPTAPRTDRVLTTVALVVLLAGAAAIYVMKPAFLTGHPTPHSTASAPPAPTVSPSALAAACRESLIVTDAPPNAEVLLREGLAPIDVEKMPVGARLEFVATADGFAPKRAVVGSDATWEPGPDGKPRFELPVQLDKSRARAGGVDNWPPGEPGSEVGGKGAPGTVRVVTMPRGAEVWLLAGLGPEARIDQLPCTKADIDVLVAGPTSLRKRLHVAQSDFVAVDGGSERVATIRAK